MNITLIIAVLIVFVVLAGIFVYVGIQSTSNQVSIEERLANFAESPMTLEELELSLPFTDRVVAPLFLGLSRRVARFMPHKNVEAIKQKLIEAGSPSSVGPTEFVGLRFVLMGLLGGAFFLLFAISGQSGTLLIFLPIALGGMGFMMPGIWLSRKVKERKKEIQLSLADAIDLLTISVEAGMGFDPALARVAEKWDNALTDEFKIMLSEMRMGSNRRAAMRALASRVNIDDLNVFVSSLVQADQLGVSISQVLRVQAKQMRLRRRQRAEEQAHKAPIKMLFPMVFLIFPALFAIILGPAIPQIINSGAF